MKTRLLVWPGGNRRRNHKSVLFYPRSHQPATMAGSAGFLSVFAVFLVFLINFSITSPTSKMSEYEIAEQLSTGINQFSQDFYKETAKLKPGENLIMSPLSAEIVLALLSLGAEGHTLSELNTAMYLPNKDFTKAAFKPAIEKLNAIEGVTLNIANKVFVMDGPQFVLKTTFKKNSVDIFQSEAQNLNFANNVESAATINGWVEDKTNKKIKDLIKSDSLSSDTRLVLVNAIYFKGNWQNQFDKAATRKRDFFLNAKDKVEVDMMHKTADFRYAENSELDAKLLELPYKGYSMSMVIILPNKVDGLSSLEAKLSSKDVNIRTIMQQMHNAEVSVALPKFRIETTIDLKKVLPKLGMNKMFSPSEAQLGGLLENNEQLYVSEAIQKAFIEVNEEGAEAAAATAIFASRAMCMLDPKESVEFVADHLFYFMLLNQERTSVFNGKVKGF